MAKIGTLVVDLKLQSATFIRDLQKAATETARNTSAMQRSMGSLQKSFASVLRSAKAFVGGFTVVALTRDVVRLTENSLRLAETMGGSLGASAKEISDRFEALGHSLELGVARGFIGELQGSMATTQSELAQLADSAELFGKGLGILFETLSAAAIQTAEDIRNIGKAINSLPAGPNGLNLVDLGSQAGAAFRDWLSNRDTTVSNMTTVTQHSANVIQGTKEIVAGFGQVVDQIDRASMESEEFWKALVVPERVTSSMELLGETLHDFGQEASSAFADAIVDGQKFGDVLKSLVKQIERTFLNNSLNALFNGLIGNPRAGGGAGPSGILGFVSALGFASGGIVRGPGSATSDSVPAQLSAGEFVVNAAATKMFRGALEAMNSMKFRLPKFASGGFVAPAAVAQAAEYVMVGPGSGGNVKVTK